MPYEKNVNSKPRSTPTLETAATVFEVDVARVLEGIPSSCIRTFDYDQDTRGASAKHGTAKRKRMYWRVKDEESGTWRRVDHFAELEDWAMEFKSRQATYMTAGSATPLQVRRVAQPLEITPKQVEEKLKLAEQIEARVESELLALRGSTVIVDASRLLSACHSKPSCSGCSAGMPRYI
jgi:hypothetical protein